jgi:hypothetical protein
MAATLALSMVGVWKEKVGLLAKSRRQLLMDSMAARRRKRTKCRRA